MHADTNAANRARPRISGHASTCFALASISAGLCASEPAYAEQTAYRLEWQRAESAISCADESSIRAQVVHQLGRDPFDDGAERTIRGRVWRDQDGWRAEIELFIGEDRKGRRAIESAARDCKSLDAAAGLAVALSIAPPQPPEPGAPEANGAELAEEPARRAQPIVEARPAPVAASPPPAAQRELAPSLLSLSGLALVGALPEPAFGVEAAASLGFTRSFAAHLLAWHLPAQTDAAGEHSFTLSALGLGACGRHGSARLELEICPAVMIGSAAATVERRVEPVDPGAEVWVGIALVPRLRLRIVGPASLQLGATAAASVQRPRFELAGEREVGPAAAMFGAQLGIALSNF